MHRPPLLILDEPTEGLDPQSRTALWEELERISSEGTTMLLTTHYMEEADRLCTRLAIIDAGRIVVEGTPGALKAGIGADSGGAAARARRQRGRQSRPVRRSLEGLVAAEDVSALPTGVALAVPNASTAIPVLLRRLDDDGLHITGPADEPAQPRRRLHEVHRSAHPRGVRRPADHHGVVTPRCTR